MLKIALLVKIVKLFHYNDIFQHLLKHRFPLKIIAGCVGGVLPDGDDV